MRIILSLFFVGALITGASAFKPVQAASDLERDAKALELYLQVICTYVLHTRNGLID